MITEELKELVKQEADNLLIHATEAERNKLSILKLSAGSVDCCIYGLMTGYCFSNRATELLQLCAVPYSRMLSFEADPIFGFNPEDKSEGRDFSPIEFYIFQMEANSESLVAYLKGESETLEL